MFYDAPAAGYDANYRHRTFWLVNKHPLCSEVGQTFLLNYYESGLQYKGLPKIFATKYTSKF